MFCPKCGGQNPEEGKFCRTCGTDLGNVSSALSVPSGQRQQLLSHKGKPIHFEGAIAKIFSGLAFLVVACILGYTGAAGGRAWWFWLLIPAFGSLGTGLAQYMQIRRAERGLPTYSAAEPQLNLTPANALPPQQGEFISQDPRYKTGDLVPPSVTDQTTRHLEIDKEGQTMALPKK